MKQHEAVIQVMRENGGYATLGLLYKDILKIPGVTWNTKTPFKSVNRIVQTHDEFFKIRPGLWALEEYCGQLPKELFLEPNSEKPQAVEFNHTYFQGLLVEIGNWENQNTYVPIQDKNRLFLGKALTEIATVSEIYPFSYHLLVKRASTVDVIWFNERNMPNRMYEVEHSTDIQNSLLKYVDLQDFNIQFFIVADESRKAQFERKIAYEAFRPIQNRVKFLSYEHLAELHSKTAELYTLKHIIGF
jgi:hypothetical protein